jgi:hypothetical protein
VSCASGTACVAVGGTLSERWDGTRWSAQRIAKAAGFKLSFASVSCPFATFCTAVGTAAVANAAFGRTGPGEAPGETFVEHWNGKRWTHQLVPVAPGGADSVVLDSVSCPTRHSCVAVGSLASKAAAEDWNGRRWSIRYVPTPPESTTSGINGVTCTPRLVCTAVGSFTDAAGQGHPLVERYS